MIKSLKEHEIDVGGLATLSIISVMAGFIFFLLGGVAQAGIIFVDDDTCPATGTGTAGDPFCKIEDAITAAVAGDTIDIAAGTYVPDGSLSGNINTLQFGPIPVDIPIPTAKSSITIQGNTGAIIDMSTRPDLSGTFKLLFGVDGPGFTLQDIEVINPRRVVIAGAVGGDDSTPKADDLTVQRVTVTYIDNGGLPTGTSRGVIFSATSVFDQNNPGFVVIPTTGMQILDNIVDSSVTPSIDGIDLRGHLDGAVIQGNMLINYADAIISNNFGGALPTFNSFNLSFLDNNITMPAVGAGEFFEGGIVLVGVEDSSVVGNTISTSNGFSPDAGIYVASRNISQTDDITIENNNVCNVRWGVNVNRDFQAGAFYTNIAIYGNAFSNTGGTADAAGIRIDAVGGNTITAEENNVINNPTGALITSGTQITFTNNNISGNTAGVDATGASPNVDARNNFWGAADGPSGGVNDPITTSLANGSGDSVSTNVRFDPFLDSNPLDPPPPCPPPEVMDVDIDIKPGSDPNSINCNNPKEIITVAILTTDVFDATTVDHTTVTFEGAMEVHVNKKTGDPNRHEKDADGDGDTDLILHFRLGDTDLTCGSTEAMLTGETFGGETIGGFDNVNMVGN